MCSNLAVVVLGHRNSGKSTTWYTLFGETQRSNRRLRRLYFGHSEYVEVFLINGSPEERRKEAGDLMSGLTPRIVLCSVQYTPHGQETIEFFQQNDYYVYAQWLNPGHNDAKYYRDRFDIVPLIREAGGTIEIRNGQQEPDSRVQEIRKFIYTWASERGLVHGQASALLVK